MAFPKKGIPATVGDNGMERFRTVDEVERDLMLLALKHFHSTSLAAQAVGVSKRTMQLRIRHWKKHDTCPEWLWKKTGVNLQ